MIENISAAISENILEPILDILSRNFVISDRYLLWFEGLQNTLIITFFALLIGLAIGFFIALIRVTHDSLDKPNIILKFANFIVKTYVTTVRGIPMIVQLFIMNFIIFAASRNLLFIAIIAFGVNSGAYVSEVFRGGILSVDKGQSEAGRSLGLSFPQTMVKIIVPQAVKNSIPAIGNEFIALLKETSIAGVIGVLDVTRANNIIRGITHDPAPLFFVAAIYLILVIFLEFLVGKMEKRLRKSEHRSGKIVEKIKRKSLIRKEEGKDD